MRTRVTVASLSVLLLAAAAPGAETPRTIIDRAMSDMRALGTAVESFAVDHEWYPGPTRGFDLVYARAAELEPVYIRTAPRLDPWGRPYLLWSSGRRYMILCVGPDGAFDMDYLGSGEPPVGPLQPARTERSADDIAMVDGIFVRVPASVLREDLGWGDHP